MSEEKQTILVIEDEAALSKSLNLGLSDEFKIIVADTGQQGLIEAKSQMPDLVLLDVMLPDQTGIDVLTALKADKATDNIPVIILTNLSDQETVSKILQAGGKDYLVKSDWTIADIVQKIKDVI